MNLISTDILEQALKEDLETHDFDEDLRFSVPGELVIPGESPVLEAVLVRLGGVLQIQPLDILYDLQQQKINARNRSKDSP